VLTALSLEALTHHLFGLFSCGFGFNDIIRGILFPLAANERTNDNNNKAIIRFLKIPLYRFSDCLRQQQQQQQQSII